jgi:hypothetical protein
MKFKKPPEEIIDNYFSNKRRHKCKYKHKYKTTIRYNEYMYRFDIHDFKIHRHKHHKFIHKRFALKLFRTHKGISGYYSFVKGK